MTIKEDVVESVKTPKAKSAKAPKSGMVRACGCALVGRHGKDCEIKKQLAMRQAAEGSEPEEETKGHECCGSKQWRHKKSCINAEATGDSEEEPTEDEPEAELPPLKRYRCVTDGCGKEVQSRQSHEKLTCSGCFGKILVQVDESEY